MKHLLSITLALMIVFMSGVAKADTWDGTAAIWTHGSGTESDPYLIESAANLAWIAEMVNGGVSTYSGQYFKMTTDIDLDSLSWTGIGTSEYVSFQGTFDGDGHSVSSINATNALFNIIRNATIRNLHTFGVAACSGIVASAYGTTSISNCHSNVTVSCNSGNAGGIICNNYSYAYISNCCNSGSINCFRSENFNTTSSEGASVVCYTGGIVGFSSAPITFTNCHNTGLISSTSESNNTYSGYMSYATARANGAGIIAGCGSSCNIDRCFNTGNVTCHSLAITMANLNSSRSYSNAAGIANGNNESLIVNNCYNRGSVTSTATYDPYSTSRIYECLSESYAVGIGGGNTQNCYNTGILDANAYMNALINGGSNYSNTLKEYEYSIARNIVSNCYYLESCGGTGDGTSKSETIMKSSVMPVLLNATDEIFTLDLTPNVNDGYPIFGYSACDVVTEDATDILFQNSTLNGSYTTGIYWPGGDADVQGFEYKEVSASSYDTVYTNVAIQFQYTLSNLTPGATYKYRAFVTKDGITLYGEEKEFTTLSCATLTASIEASTLELCEGDTATLTAIGSSAYSDNFTYQWNTNASIAEIRSTEAGTYTVTVTDDNGCTTTQSAELTVNPNPQGTISGRTSICSGNSTTLTASGANSYSWSTGATTPTLTTSTAGTYTCTFRNSYGCTSTQDVTINVFAAPTISGTTAICSGNSTTLTASGADSYSWSNGATTPSITITEAGTYTVTGSTSDGCNGSAGVTVSVGALPTITIGGNTSFCQGASTTLTAMGGDTYEWNNGTTGSTLTVTTPGTYVVTGTNASGCSNTASIQVTTKPSYVNLPVSAAICQGASYSAMGSTFSTAGTYHIEGYTTEGCDSIIDLTLTVNQLPTPTITGNTNICEGVSTTLAALGGTSFLWNNGSTGQTINVSNAGVYSVTVTDANGCSNSTSATVSVNPRPTVTISGSTAICAGNSTTLTAQGADSYLWNNGSNGQSITVTNAGSYTVTGTSANGCDNTTAVTVTVNPVYTNVPVTQAICEGSSYNFFGTLLTTAGSYSHNGTSLAGCDSVVSLTLTVNPLPTATISGNTTFCEGQNTSLTASGGASYLWNNGATTQNITVNNGGAYSVTVTDANGCSNTTSTTVTVNTLPNITISGNTSFCEGANTTLTAQGGNSYVWSNGSQSASVNVSTSGNYTVTGTGANGCTNTASVAVMAEPTPTITVSGNTSFCQGGSTTLTASGADSYTWSNGTTTPSVTIDAFGVYNVTGTTATGCTGSASVTITVSPNPTITITGDTELCPGETTTLTAAGGTSYMWFDGTTSATYQTGTAGNYTVIGYNDAGCYSMVSVDVQQYDNAQSEETATGYGEYVWNGNVYTESGDYTFETVTEHGCDSTVTLHLTIEENGQGIDDIAADEVRVYARGGEIVIEGADDSDALVYDVMGRIVHKGRIEAPIHVNAMGVYMVKVGGLPTQKVVVR